MNFSSDDAKTLHQIMQWRRDVRHCRPYPAVPDLIDKLAASMEIDKLAASMEMAPAVANCRPWRVIRVQVPQRLASQFRAAVIDPLNRVPRLREGSRPECLGDISGSPVNSSHF